MLRCPCAVRAGNSVALVWYGRVSTREQDLDRQEAGCTRCFFDKASYIHDANNNVIDQTVKGTTTAFNYDRNRSHWPALSLSASDYRSAWNATPIMASRAVA
ncbi:hypothetical protein AB0J85_28635 [Micromonospora echinofusca]|uniref:hypothetical protein n=1 Tax=Micromonospora echinofusca TaxID=47858 RepID=UPI0034258783